MGLQIDEKSKLSIFTGEAAKMFKQLLADLNKRIIGELYLAAATDKERAELASQAGKLLAQEKQADDEGELDLDAITQRMRNGVTVEPEAEEPVGWKTRVAGWISRRLWGEAEGTPQKLRVVLGRGLYAVVTLAGTLTGCVSTGFTQPETRKVDFSSIPVQLQEARPDFSWEEGTQQQVTAEQAYQKLEELAKKKLASTEFQKRNAGRSPQELKAIAFQEVLQEEVNARLSPAAAVGGQTVDGVRYTPKLPVSPRNYEQGLANAIVKHLVNAAGGHVAIATNPITEDDLEMLGNIYFYYKGEEISAREPSSKLYQLIKSDINKGTLDNIRNIEIWIGKKGTNGAKPYIATDGLGKQLVMDSLAQLNSIRDKIHLYRFSQAGQPKDRYGRGEEITSPDTIRELQERGISFDIWVEGEDAQGEYAYRLHFGQQTALKTIAEIRSYAQSRALEEITIGEILSTMSIGMQQGLIEKYNAEGIQPMGIAGNRVKDIFGAVPPDPMQKRSPYVGAIVAKKNSSPAEVRTYLQSDNLNQNYADELDLPRVDGRTGFDIVYYFFKDAQGKLDYQRMHFLSYNRLGQLVEVNARDKHDVIALSPHRDSKDKNDEEISQAQARGDWTKSDVIWFGKNALNEEIINTKIGELMHRITIDNALKSQKQLKARIVLEAILLPINLMGGYGSSHFLTEISRPGWQALIRLVFDIGITSQNLPTGAKMSGPPSKENVETFLMSYLYYREGPGKGQLQKPVEELLKDEAFLKYYKEEKGKKDSHLNQWLTMAQDSAANRSFVDYVEGQKDYGVARYFLGILDNLARLNYKDFNQQSNVFRNILASKYFSLTGEINVMGVIGAIIDKDVLGSGFNMQAIREGWGDSWENYLNIVGVTVDAQEIINTLFTVSGNKMPFAYDEKYPFQNRKAFNVYLLGFPVFTFFELKSSEAFTAHADEFAFGVKTSNKPWHSTYWVHRVTGYNEGEFLSLNLVPLGDVTYVGEDKVPVRRVYYYNPDTKEIVFLGNKGYESKIKRLEEDVARFDEYLSLIGPRGGRIEKRDHDAGVILDSFEKKYGQRVSPEEFNRGLLSFMMNTRHPVTGLTPSHVYTTDNPTNKVNWAFLYDIALESLGLSAGGVSRQSDTMLNYLIKNRWLYKQDDAQKRNNGVYNAVDISRLPDLKQKPISEYLAHAGPNSWLIATLLEGTMRHSNPDQWQAVRNEQDKHKENFKKFIKTGNIDYLFRAIGERESRFFNFLGARTKLQKFLRSTNAQGRTYFEQARKTADFLISLQDKDGGIRHGPMHLHQKSTEENVVSFGAFMMMYEITGESKYKKAAIGVLDWLATSGVYDQNRGLFYRGMTLKEYKDKKGVWVVDTIYATDANALALIVIGPEILNNLKHRQEYRFGDDAAQRIMENLSSRQVKVDHYVEQYIGGKKVGSEKVASEVLGHDFTDRTGRGKREAVVSPEMTSHVIKAHKTMAAYYKSIGRTDLAEQEEKIAAELLRNLEKLSVSTPLGISLPDCTLPESAPVEGLRRYKDSDFIIGSQASMNALWMILAREDVNPFDIDNTLLRVQAQQQPTTLDKYTGNNYDILKLKGQIDALKRQKQAAPKSWSRLQEKRLVDLRKKLSELVDTRAKEYTKPKIVAGDNTSDAVLDEILGLLDISKERELTPDEQKKLAELKTKHPYYEGWVKLAELAGKQSLERKIKSLEAAQPLTPDEKTEKIAQLKAQLDVLLRNQRSPEVNKFIRVLEDRIKQTEAAPTAKEKQDQLSKLKAQLATYGPDRLIHLDMLKGIYKYFDADKNSTVTVTLLAPAKVIQREFERREQERENARRMFELLDKGGVIITDPQSGRLIKDGIQPGRSHLEEFLKDIESREIPEQQKIMREHWVFNTEYNGKKVTVTLVFPYHEDFVRKWVNPVSNRLEIRVFKHGLLHKIITTETISVIEYNKFDIEAGTRTFDNKTGRLAANAELGEPLEVAVTVAYDTTDKDHPILTKRIVDLVKNITRYEVYKDYPLPVKIFNEKHITEVEYDQLKGRFKSAVTWFNKGTLDNPVKGDKVFVDALAGFDEATGITTITRGDLRFEIEKTITRDWRGRQGTEKYVDPFDGTRELKKRVETEYDKAFFFGLIPSRILVYSDDTNTLLQEIRMIDYTKENRSLVGIETDKITGAEKVTIWQNLQENPALKISTHQMTFTETNQAETENLSVSFGFVQPGKGGFDIGAFNALDTQDRRKMVNDWLTYGRSIMDACKTRTTPVMRGKDEVVSTSQAKYDAAIRRFRDTRKVWHNFRDNILSHTEIDTRSVFGKLINTRITSENVTEIDELLRIPVYDDRGSEVASQTFRWNEDSEKFDIFYRYDDQYEWDKGERTAFARVYLGKDTKTGDSGYRSFKAAEDDGHKHLFDSFYEQQDDEGRVAAEIRDDWMLKINHDGATNRRREAVLSHKGVNIGRSDYHQTVKLKEIAAALNISGSELAKLGLNGETFLVPVTFRSVWGEEYTDYLKASDYLGRAMVTVLRDGDKKTRDEWIPGTNFATLSRLLNKENITLRIYKSAPRYISELFAKDQESANGKAILQLLNLSAAAEISEFVPKELIEGATDDKFEKSHIGIFKLVPLAAVNAGTIDINRFDVTTSYVKDGQDTYEVIDNQIKKKILITFRDQDFNTTEIRRWLEDNGFTDSARDLRNSETFDVYVLGSDETTRIKHWKITYKKNRDKELIKIEDSFDINRLGVVLYSPEDRLQVAGLDLDYTGGRIGEILGIAVVTDKFEEMGGKHYKKIFTLNAKTKHGYFEHRNKQDGALEFEDSGRYTKERRNAFVRKLQALIEAGDYRTARELIVEDYGMISRSENIYMDFGDYSSVFLRRLGIPGSVQTKLWNEATGTFDDETTSSSVLGNLIITDQGIRIEVMRDDAIRKHIDPKANIDVVHKYTIEVRDGAGRKIELWFSSAEPAGRDLTEKFSNFIPEMKYYEFYMFEGPRAYGFPVHGKYKIPDKSMVTIVLDEDDAPSSRPQIFQRDQKEGREFVHALSNATSLYENGDISYATQKGIRTEPLDITAASSMQAYEKLRAQCIAGQIKLDKYGIDESYREEKDNLGHFVRRLDGYTQYDSATGFVMKDAHPKWVTFMIEHHEVMMFHIGVPKVGYTYAYDINRNTSEGYPDEDQYAIPSRLAWERLKASPKYALKTEREIESDRWENSNWVAKTPHKSFTRRHIVVDVDDKRKDRVGFEELRSTLDGRLDQIKAKWDRLQVMKGILGMAVNGSKITYYSPFERAVKSVNDADRDFVITEFVEITSGIENGVGIRSKQKTNEREGLAPDKVFEQTYAYLNGEVVDKERTDLWGEWKRDLKQNWLVFTISAFGLLVFVRALGILLSKNKKSSRWTRRMLNKWSKRFVKGVLRRKPEKDLATRDEVIEIFGKGNEEKWRQFFYFPEEDELIFKDKFEQLINQAQLPEDKKDTLRALEAQFRDNQKGFNPIYKGYTVWLDLMGKKDNESSADNIEERFWEVYQKVDKLRDSPDFVYYFVWRTRSGALIKEGSQIDNEIKFWFHFYIANQRLGQNFKIGTEYRMIYEDFNNLFRTKEFLERYESEELPRTSDKGPNLGGYQKYTDIILKDFIALATVEKVLNRLKNEGMQINIDGAAERLTDILKFLSEHGILSAGEFAEELAKVSTDAIRNVLNELKVGGLDFNIDDLEKIAFEMAKACAEIAGKPGPLDERQFREALRKSDLLNTAIPEANITEVFNAVNHRLLDTPLSIVNIPQAKRGQIFEALHKELKSQLIGLLELLYYNPDQNIEKLKKREFEIGEKSLIWKTYRLVEGGMLGLRGWFGVARGNFKVFSLAVIGLFAATWPVAFAFGGIVLLYYAIGGLVVIGIGLRLFHNYLRRLTEGKDKKFVPPRLDEGYAPLRDWQWWKETMFAGTIMVISLGLKIIWNYFFFKWASVSTVILLGSSWSMTPLFLTIGVSLVFIYLLIKIARNKEMTLKKALISLAIPTLGAIVLFSAANLLLVLGLWIVFTAFYLLDIFVIFYGLEAITGYLYGEMLGIGKFKTWGRLRKTQASDADTFGEKFKEKFIPAALGFNKQEKEEIWQIYWNEIIATMYEEDRLSEEEKERYSYGPDGKKPDFSKAPEDEDVNERIRFFLSSMFMDTPAAPDDWDDINSRITVLPQNDEDVLYHKELLDDEVKSQGVNVGTNVTFLCYLIQQYPHHWINFVRRMERKGEFSANEITALKDIFNEVKRGNINDQLGPRIGHGENAEKLWLEVRFWASDRFQPSARTVKGVMYRRKAMMMHAKHIYSRRENLSEHNLDDKVDKKYKFIIGYQTYAEQLDIAALHIIAAYSDQPGKTDEWQTFIAEAEAEDFSFDEIKKLREAKAKILEQSKNKQKLKHSFDNMSDDLRIRFSNFVTRVYSEDARKDTRDISAAGIQAYARVEGIQQLMKRYPHLRVSYLSRGSKPKVDAMDVILMCSKDRDERQQLRGHFWFGADATQGKPEHQKVLSLWTEGFDKVEVIDMNQEDYLEEAYKDILVAQEFKRPNVHIVGIPERIFTNTFSLKAKFLAFADSVFANLVQRVLALAGVRMHYGHPDMFDRNAALSIGWTSSSSKLNEDIYAGYRTLLRGGRVKFIEYRRVGKAREVSFATALVLFTKFGRGAGEQAKDQIVYWLNTSRNFGVMKVFFFFVGSIGFFLRKPPVRMAIKGYIWALLLFGISGFAAFPSEVIFGVIGLLASQGIVSTGWAELVLRKGLIKGTGELLGMMFRGKTPFFMGQIYTYDKGVREAMEGIAGYLGTGRGPMLHHIPPFHPKAQSLYKDFLGGKQMSVSVVLDMLAIVTAIVIWWCPPMLWSLFFLAMPFAAYYYPVLTNPGATPAIVGWARWARLYGLDFGLWIETIKAQKSWKDKATIFIHGFLLFPVILVVSIIVGVITPIMRGIKRIINLAKKHPLRTALLTAVAVVAGLIMLLSSGTIDSGQIESAVEYAAENKRMFAGLGLLFLTVGGMGVAAKKYVDRRSKLRKQAAQLVDETREEHEVDNLWWLVARTKEEFDEQAKAKLLVIRALISRLGTESGPSERQRFEQFLQNFTSSDYSLILALEPEGVVGCLYLLYRIRKETGNIELEDGTQVNTYRFEFTDALHPDRIAQMLSGLGFEQIEERVVDRDVETSFNREIREGRQIGVLDILVSLDRVNNGFMVDMKNGATLQPPEESTLPPDTSVDEPKAPDTGEPTEQTPPAQVEADDVEKDQTAAEPEVEKAPVESDDTEKAQVVEDKVEQAPVQPQETPKEPVEVPAVEPEKVAAPAVEGVSDREARNRALLLSIGANPDTATFAKLLLANPELLEEKITLLKKLQEEGKLKSRSGKIPISLLNYSAQTLENRAARLNRYDIALNSGNIRFRNEDKLRKWILGNKQLATTSRLAKVKANLIDIAGESQDVSVLRKDLYAAQAQEPDVTKEQEQLATAQDLKDEILRRQAELNEQMHRTGEEDVRLRTRNRQIKEELKILARQIRDQEMAIWAYNQQEKESSGALHDAIEAEPKLKALADQYPVQLSDILLSLKRDTTRLGQERKANQIQIAQLAEIREKVQAELLKVEAQLAEAEGRIIQQQTALRMAEEKQRLEISALIATAKANLDARVEHLTNINLLSLEDLERNLFHITTNVMGRDTAEMALTIIVARGIHGQFNSPEDFITAISRRIDGDNPRQTAIRIYNHLKDQGISFDQRAVSIEEIKTVRFYVSFTQLELRVEPQAEEEIPADITPDAIIRPRQPEKAAPDVRKVLDEVMPKPEKGKTPLDEMRELVESAA